jgi:hypothetical protein
MRGPPSGFGLFCHKTYTRTKGLLLLFTQNILRYQAASIAMAKIYHGIVASNNLSDINVYIN